MCLTIPGRVTQVQGPMAEVETEGQSAWFNALMRPEVQVGDYVLTHANLIVSIISAEEAQQMLDAARELADAAEQESRQEGEQDGSGGPDPASKSDQGSRP
ncbi:MAG TPA: HypC/HybG/HupF family hydrogenase formation chaperone [Ktedonobacterales bacterium]|jgi:hydrogenase expression/formation protein HypC|nr:HypC/HybG/HupF family hydrogenase formation chaperone [Ktedonobacterales bacterium]